MIEKGQLRYKESDLEFKKRIDNLNKAFLEWIKSGTILLSVDILIIIIIAYSQKMDFAFWFLSLFGLSVGLLGSIIFFYFGIMCKRTILNQLKVFENGLEPHETILEKKYIRYDEIENFERIKLKFSADQHYFVKGFKIQFKDGKELKFNFNNMNKILRQGYRKANELWVLAKKQ